MPGSNFTFEISLSVLDHLGRNLYRSFATVLGEAISNAWDADAKNVWIHFYLKDNSFLIKDDGVGMNADDFQNKLLKIGYSKRKSFGMRSAKDRPFIGRKGIGKLALLSCADRITVISKVAGESYVGGEIENAELDKAITNDVTPQEYGLNEVDINRFSAFTGDHSHGTIIYFEGMKDGIRKSIGTLRKIVALYFRFSLVDPEFRIFIDGDAVSLNDLESLADNTEFVWNINALEDPYLKVLGNLKEAAHNIAMDGKIQGFVASVRLPRHLAIAGTSDRAGVDLFVNGRLRERDILKHIPTARIAENYFYGQIHFNELDDDEDRFTSSREGIVADDPKFQVFLQDLRKVVLEIVAEWDDLRRKYRQDGDPENDSIPPKNRKSQELFNAVSEEFSPEAGAPTKSKVDGWLDELGTDAVFNFTSYAECFVAENLIRRYIVDKSLPMTAPAETEIKNWKDREVQHKEDANIAIDIRQNPNDLGYLDMSFLTKLVSSASGPTGLNNDAKEYRPIRNALAHTALLTTEAKTKLTSVFNNIRARIKALLSSP